jgi:hypothetical protein
MHLFPENEDFVCTVFEVEVGIRCLEATVIGCVGSGFQESEGKPDKRLSVSLSRRTRIETWLPVTGTSFT